VITVFESVTNRYKTGIGLFAVIFMCSSTLTVLDCFAASPDIDGGVTGIVYTSHDSLSNGWIPMQEVVVLVKRSERDSLVASQTAEIEVSFGSVNPKIQVAQPGSPLKITALGTRPIRLSAKTKTGDEIFNIALPLPSLEVIKRLSTEGIITFHNAELDPDSVLARIIVTPHFGWTRTDTSGAYIIPGIPPSCHAIWCYDPMRGSVFDTVCVEPAKAVPIDMYLPDLLYSQSSEEVNE